MEILRLSHTQFYNAYGILCASPPQLVDRNGLYPTFCRIQPGSNTITHAHFEPEVFYIVSGSGLMIINDETEKVYAGDLVRIPPLAKHELKNNNDHDLLFLSIYSEDFETPKLPQNLLITAAPPTPNGSLHLGHISGPYLASDIAARYLALRSVNVHSHCGTDDHQNYVYTKANSLQINAEKYRKKMRVQIQKDLAAIGIHYHEFIEPKLDQHYQTNIRKFFDKALQTKVIQLEPIELPYCNECNCYLIDALIDAICPCCNGTSKGACENCGMVIAPHDLLQAKCSKCAKPASRKLESVYTFSLSKYFSKIQNELDKLPLPIVLRNLIQRVKHTKNLKVLITHPDSTNQGIFLPELNQVLHVWFEMAAHYAQFSLSDKPWMHCFGFDNSFYYLCFIPSLLRAIDAEAKLPDYVITNEFLLLDGLKFSTSREHVIWVDNFSGNTDHLRLYLSLHRPAYQTADFTLENFQTFSDKLEKNLQQLIKHARQIKNKKNNEISSQKLIDCNRTTRDMEKSLSPQHFDLRRASRQLLGFLDLTLQSVVWGNSEKMMLKVLAILMLPFMPIEAKKILNALGENSYSWKRDWTNA